MIDSFLPTILSNTLIAFFLGLTAWYGSRIHQRPSLWHAVWVLALLKLFTPTIWSLSVPSFNRALSSLQSTSVARHDASAINSNVWEVGATLPTSELDGTGKGSTPNQVPSVSPWISLQLPWPAALLSAWVLGSSVIAVLSTVRIARFHAAVRRGLVPEQATSACMDSAAGLFESRSLPRVCLVDIAIPPLLWPIGRTAVIVLPARWWATATLTEKSTVLMHELAHWRRGDHWVRWLQWVASIVLWWHPLVWIACREICRLEEQCCDAEVMHRLPNEGRAYASALISVSQWLGSTETEMSRHETSLLAIPMSHCVRFESFHRRIQMLPNLSYRPLTRRGLIALVLMTFVPLSSGIIAQDPEGKDGDKPRSVATNDDEQTATLKGRVTDIDGKPLAGAKVRVVVPAAELRQFSMSSEFDEAWGTTDPDGRYTIDIENLQAPTRASIDVLHKGHRRLIGTFMMGGDPNEVTLTPSTSVSFDAKLPETLYFAGTVVDEAGKPIEGVTVFSSLNTKRSSGGIENVTTDAEGRFAIYGYEEVFFKPSAISDTYTAAVSFRHDNYMEAAIRKLEELDPSSRDSLRVVMKSGSSIGGTVLGADGAPAADVAISVTQTEPYQRKAMRTDERGQFRFDGVNSGKASLRVVDVQGNRKSIQELNVEETNLKMQVSLKSFEKPFTQTHDVLGMSLTSITDAVDDAYDLQAKKSKIGGAMIVDPGNRFEPLEIGELRHGYYFWMVGNDRVGNLHEMVTQLVKEAKSPRTPRGADGNMSAFFEDDGTAKVRVVYGYNDDQGHGTNTQYMKLTPQDVAELEKVLERLESEAQE